MQQLAIAFVQLYRLQYWVCAVFLVCVFQVNYQHTYIASYDKYTLHEKYVSHPNLKTHKQ